MRLTFRLKFWFTRTLWNVGQRLKEWSCVLAGGTHDYKAGEDTCFVCDHKKKRPQLSLVK